MVRVTVINAFFFICYGKKWGKRLFYKEPVV